MTPLNPNELSYWRLSGALMLVRILAALERAEAREPNVHLKDDYRIAWGTVLRAGRGESHPHFWATYSVLRMAPDEVWPSIVARRKAMLGSSYEEFFGVQSPPKKPAASEPSNDRTAIAQAA